MDFTLADLKKEAKEQRKQLEDIEAAIRVMERLSGSGHKNQLTHTIEKPQPTLSASGKINLDDLSVPISEPKKATLFKDIKALIERFDNQEFSISHIEAALKQTGKGSNAKHFRNRIYVHIRKLLEEGVVVRTYKGSGNEPHKYKLASKVDSKITNLSSKK